MRDCTTLPNHEREKTPWVLTPAQPLSLVLGAGGVRGMAHIGVLEALTERGFHFSEIVGTSVGALILSFYAAVGFDLPQLRRLGLNLTTRHLLVWALLRRLPSGISNRFRHLAGIIPENIDLLAVTSAQKLCLHHGVERIGMAAYDLIRREEVFFHNLQADFPLEDAVRGSICIPGLFPSRRCVVGNRRMRLIDGGIVNGLPVEVLFSPPFQPIQVLVVDISDRLSSHTRHVEKIEHVQQMYPAVPIQVIYPDRLGTATIIYQTRNLQALIDAGRRAVERMIPEP